MTADWEAQTDDATRLDVYLVRHGAAASRREARELVALGQVLVNGRRPRKGQTIRAGDRVEAIGREAPVLHPNPAMPLDVLYTGAMLVVVNKPGLVPCHPLASGERDTVMNAVAARFPETARIPSADASLVGFESKPLEGLLVHRLDNGTSGALMVARSASGLVRLREALRRGRVRRVYAALVEGILTDPIDIQAPIAHHPRNRRKMVAADCADRERLHARSALTTISPVRRIGRFTLVKAVPATGSRHQIRVHLATVGYPIVGDTLYGAQPFPALAFGRFFLHLGELSVPRTLCAETEPPSASAEDETITICAPLAADLADAIAGFGSQHMS